MVLKRLSNIIVLLFVSFLLYAHPFIDGIEGYMKKHRIEDIHELIGCVK